MCIYSTKNYPVDREWMSKLEKEDCCLITGVALSSITLLVGVFILFGIPQLGIVGSSAFIVSGGIPLILLCSRAIFLLAKGRLSLEKYIQSLPTEYLQENFATLFPDDEKHGFHFLTKKQIPDLLDVFEDHHFQQLSQSQMKSLTGNAVKKYLFRFSDAHIEMITKKQIEDLDISDFDEPLVTRLFSTDFCFFERSKKLFSYLNHEKVFNLFNQNLLQDRLEMISKDQLAKINEDFFRRLPSHEMGNLFPAFPFGEKERFEALSASHLFILLKKDVLDEYFDRISAAQLAALDLQFFQELRKDQVEKLFPPIYDGPYNKDRFKSLNHDKTHVLLPKISREITSLISENQLKKLDPNLLNDLQIRHLFGDTRVTSAYALLEEKHRLKSAKFTLRIRSLGIQHLIQIE